MPSQDAAWSSLIVAIWICTIEVSSTVAIAEYGD